MKKINRKEIVESSFRDTSGFLFFKGKSIFRQINLEYKENYDFLMECGLYEKLVKKGFLVAHQDVTEEFTLAGNAYKIIKPDVVPFISYPYEWCYSQMKDAALATLEIQKIAFNSGNVFKRQQCLQYSVCQW